MSGSASVHQIVRFSLVGSVSVSSGLFARMLFSSGGCDLTLLFTGKGNEGGVRVVLAIGQ
jgi:hypothetical protein